MPFSKSALMLSLLVTSTASFANPANSSVTQTDVIGSQEAPAVLNVVPWKEKEIVVQKKEISTSILQETLEPMDSDVLIREIQIYQNL